MYFISKGGAALGTNTKRAVFDTFFSNQWHGQIHTAKVPRIGFGRVTFLKVWADGPNDVISSVRQTESNNL